ncbi:MAG: hypothetical protein UH080_00975 [Ruminococcus sp.]|jgi:hypothetical protein|nr:hypothetical protein [Ruminococcus sp.]
MKKIILFLFCTMMIFSLCCCSESTSNESEIIDEPQKTATSDQIEPSKNADAIEVSPNVNGKRFNMTLEEFTGRYNEIMLGIEGIEFLNADNWKKLGEPEKDINEVEYQCYYYDANKIEFTATVEINTQEIMNIGCGTTEDTFVAFRGEESYSDIILKKSAVMAAAACGYGENDVDTFRHIFYSITYKDIDSLLYDSVVFNFTVNKNKDPKKNTLLYRCFPISDHNAQEWKIEEYVL